MRSGTEARAPLLGLYLRLPGLALTVPNFTTYQTVVPMDAPVLVPACLLHSKTQELEDSDSETRTRTSELCLGVGTLTWKALTRCWQAGASTRVEVAVAFPHQQPSHATANESQRWRPRLAVREAIAKA